jgi:hypothetical protein
MGEAKRTQSRSARETLDGDELSDDLMLDGFDPPQEADPTWWQFDMLPWDFLYPQIPF